MHPSSIVEDIRHILSRRQKQGLTEAGRIPAAVLIAIFGKNGEPYVLFTRRTQDVEYHKGQICFPGGACDDGESHCEAALREAYEEVGIKPEDVEILGELDDMKTVTSHFIVSPFVAHIPYPYQFRPNPRELEEILEFPLAGLRNKKNWREEEGAADDGTRIQVHFVECEGAVVWGATAKILKQLVDLLDNKA